MTATRMNFERRVSRAARWASTIANFSLVLGCTAVVGHRYGMVETWAFVWIAALVAALAVLAILLAVVGFGRLWSRGDKAGKASLAAVLVSALVLTPFGVAAYLSRHHPELHDVSTDLSEPPIFSRAARSRTSDMNPIGVISAETAVLQREAYPEISGRRFEASIERVMAAADVVIAERGWTVGAHTTDGMVGGEISVELVAPSLILRLPTDVVIRFTDEGESTFVDMRSNTRYGRHDLGENARRIRGFLDQLDAEFARQSLSIIDIPASAEGVDAVE